MHESVKALAQAAIIPGLGVLASERRTNLRNDHLKKLLETTLTTKMATTLDHVTGSTLVALVDKQINQMMP